MDVRTSYRTLSKSKRLYEGNSNSHNPVVPSDQRINKFHNGSSCSSREARSSCRTIGDRLNTSPRFSSTRDYLPARLKRRALCCSGARKILLDTLPRFRSPRDVTSCVCAPMILLSEQRISDIPVEDVLLPCDAGASAAGEPDTAAQPTYEHNSGSLLANGIEDSDNCQNTTLLTTETSVPSGRKSRSSSKLSLPSPVFKSKTGVSSMAGDDYSEDLKAVTATFPSLYRHQIRLIMSGKKTLQEASSLVDTIDVKQLRRLLKRARYRLNKSPIWIRRFRSEVALLAHGTSSNTDSLEERSSERTTLATGECVALEATCQNPVIDEGTFPCETFPPVKLISARQSPAFISRVDAVVSDFPGPVQKVIRNFLLRKCTFLGASRSCGLSASILRRYCQRARYRLRGDSKWFTKNYRSSAAATKVNEKAGPSSCNAQSSSSVTAKRMPICNSSTQLAKFGFRGDGRANYCTAKGHPLKCNSLTEEPNSVPSTAHLTPENARPEYDIVGTRVSGTPSCPRPVAAVRRSSFGNGDPDGKTSGRPSLVERRHLIASRLDSATKDFPSQIQNALRSILLGCMSVRSAANTNGVPFCVLYKYHERVKYRIFVSKTWSSENNSGSESVVNYVTRAEVLPWIGQCFGNNFAANHPHIVSAVCAVLCDRKPYSFCAAKYNLSIAKIRKHVLRLLSHRGIGSIGELRGSVCRTDAGWAEGSRPRNVDLGEAEQNILSGSMEEERWSPDKMDYFTLTSPCSMSRLPSKKPQSPAAAYAMTIAKKAISPKVRRFNIERKSMEKAVNDVMISTRSTAASSKCTPQLESCIRDIFLRGTDNRITVPNMNPQRLRFAAKKFCADVCLLRRCYQGIRVMVRKLISRNRKVGSSILFDPQLMGGGGSSQKLKDHSSSYGYADWDASGPASVGTSSLSPRKFGSGIRSITARVIARTTSSLPRGLTNSALENAIVYAFKFKTSLDDVSKAYHIPPDLLKDLYRRVRAAVDVQMDLALIFKADQGSVVPPITKSLGITSTSFVESSQSGVESCHSPELGLGLNTMTPVGDDMALLKSGERWEHSCCYDTLYTVRPAREDLVRKYKCRRVLRKSVKA